MTAPGPPAPVLVTERLELWRPAPGDLAGLVALVDDAETMRHLGREPEGEQGQFARLLRNAGSWSLHGYGVFQLREKGRPDLVGCCGVFHSWRGFGKGLDDVPEAGWILRRDMWGKGLATEAMTAALAWFDAAHGPRRIACMIDEDNHASHKLAARLGFAEYGRHEQDGVPPVTLVLYERG